MFCRTLNLIDLFEKKLLSLLLIFPSIGVDCTNVSFVRSFVFVLFFFFSSLDVYKLPIQPSRASCFDKRH